MDQPGQPPLLGRTPAIVIKVLNPAKINLDYSSLDADGVEITLYQNSKDSTIYGVPTGSLPTGTLNLNLALYGQGTDANGYPELLDNVSWRQEIIGDRTAELWPGKQTATLNDETVQLEAAPYIHSASSSTMLPFRFVADVMGAQVGWNASSKQVTFKLDNKTVVLTIGSRTAKVNGKSVTMATAPAIVNGRAMVPLRFVSESLGAFVNWNNTERKATIQVAEHPIEG